MQYEGILGTNLFLRYLYDGKEVEKEKFKKLISEATRKGTVFFVPSIVIIEMVYVLERIYGLSKSEVREIVESVFSLPVEVENFEVILKALALYEEKNLKFGDSLVRAYAQVRGIKPIYTFDCDFKKFPEAQIL